MMASSSFLREIVLQLDYLAAETKYGYWRETSLHTTHIPRFLVELQDAIIRRPVPRNKGSPGDVPSRSSVNFSHIPLSGTMLVDVVSRQPGIFTPTAMAKPLPTRDPILRATKPLLLSQEPEVGPPFLSSWLQEGDVVDASDDDSMKDWQRAIVHAVNSNKVSSVEASFNFPLFILSLLCLNLPVTLPPSRLNIQFDGKMGTHRC
jgi:hypothetical protein